MCLNSKFVLQTFKYTIYIGYCYRKINRFGCGAMVGVGKQYVEEQRLDPEVFPLFTDSLM